MNIFWKEMCMEKVRKKLIREKAVIAVYQYLLTNSTEEEIMNYLNECYKPRMDEREIELCKEIRQLDRTRRHDAVGGVSARGQ